MPSRLGRALGAIVVLGALGLLASAAPALAASGCAKQVIADWYDNGRVDRIYDLHCYREAIKSLPPDVRDYSSAREDIQRALQFAVRGQQDPGGGAGDGGATPPKKPPPTKPPPTKPPASGGKGSGRSNNSSGTPGSRPPQGGTEPGTTSTPTVAAEPPVDQGTEAAEPVDTSSPSSVPIPLIVLGGLALLLLAAGSAGYLTRRLQARRGGSDPPPPA